MHAGRWLDQDAVLGDLRDPPAAGAQDDDVAVHPGAQLVHHLLVELAHPGAVGQEHAVQPAVGDGAGVGDGQPLGTGAPAHDAERGLVLLRSLPLSAEPRELPNSNWCASRKPRPKKPSATLPSNCSRCWPNPSS